MLYRIKVKNKKLELLGQITVEAQNPTEALLRAMTIVKDDIKLSDVNPIEPQQETQQKPQNYNERNAEGITLSV